jgi:HEAT repeat protein
LQENESSNRLAYRVLLARAYAADEDTLRASLTSKRSAERLAASYVIGERQLLWTPELIDRLTDSNRLVRQAARRSLIILSYYTLRDEDSGAASLDSQATKPPTIVDFGPKPDADQSARERSAKEWEEWWDKNGGGDKTKGSALRAVRDETALDAEAARLGAALVFAPPEKQAELLARYREQKGVVYTEGLANALAQLDGPILSSAREALAERLTRMKASTLRDRLSDPRAELRRAAALAWAMKDDRSAIPELIALLEDSEELVVRAAKAGLKSLAGQDFGPGRGAKASERAAAVTAWKSWWQNQQKLSNR